MKIKILCLVLIVAVLCSIFVISASADEDYVIEAGTYVFNDTISPMPVDSVELSFTLVPILFEVDDNGQTVTSSFTFTGTRIDNEANYLEYIGSFLMDDAQIGSFFPAYFYETNHWEDTLDIESEGGTIISGSPFKWGQTIIITTDTSVDPSFASWFASSTSRVPDTSVISSGYYRLVLPIDVTDPSWIGSGNTVWYNMRGRVITDNSNRAFSFYRLGFRYNSWEASVDRAAGWSLDVLINDSQHDELEILDITYFADNGQFYWMYNDLVLDSFVGLAFDGYYEVDNDLYGLFTELFEPYEYVYTGNPWYDIVDGVVDALKIDVFGSFSPWDILVTFIGISVFIWLLKLLAGG